VIGVGYDSHRFEEGRPLVIGGVEADPPGGLEFVHAGAGSNAWRGYEH